MKASILSRLTALVIGLTMTNQVQAQPVGLPAPTTRILAIETLVPGADLAAVRAILPTEVGDTVKLYLDGKIDQWFSLADRNGVVFLLNETDPKAATAMLEDLPLGKAHLSPSASPSQYFRIEDPICKWTVIRHQYFA
jgi:hypothetical protein